MGGVGGKVYGYTAPCTWYLSDCRLQHGTMQYRLSVRFASPNSESADDELLTADGHM